MGLFKKWLGVTALENSLNDVIADVKKLSDKVNSNQTVTNFTDTAAITVQIKNLNDKTNDITKSLESITKNHDTDLQAVKSDLSDIKKDMTLLAEIDALKAELQEIKKLIANLKVGDTDSVKTIGAVSQNNIYFDMTGLAKGTYTLKYIDKNNKALNDWKEITKVTL